MHAILTKNNTSTISGSGCAISSSHLPVETSWYCRSGMQLQCIQSSQVSEAQQETTGKEQNSLRLRLENTCQHRLKGGRTIYRSGYSKPPTYQEVLFQETVCMYVCKSVLGWTCVVITLRYMYNQLYFQMHQYKQ